MKLPTAPVLATLRMPSVTWLLAGLLLACALTLNVSSSGITGGDDAGSGIGGTGKSLEPGSGLGGTGRKPFLGFDPNSATGPEPASRELIILPPDANPELAITESLALDIPATRDIEQAPLPSPAQVASVESFTRDSSAISITEQIQRDLDSNALYFTRSIAGASLARGDSHGDSPDPTSGQSVTADATEPGEAALTPADALAVVSDHSGEALTWNSLASYLAAQQPVADADQHAAEDSAQAPRLERPERIVRPELPPVQRVRPIQRAAVLPPRIKPLSL